MILERREGYAKEVLGDEQVTDQRCDSTAVATIQYRLWGGKMKTRLFTTLTIATMHLPSLLLVPHHGIVRVIQSAVFIRIDLKRSVDCFRLGPRNKGQRDGQPIPTILHALWQFIPSPAFELHIGAQGLFTLVLLLTWEKVSREGDAYESKIAITAVRAR